MKLLSKLWIMMALSLVGISKDGLAQTDADDAMKVERAIGYAMDRVDPAMSISYRQLDKAMILGDIIEDYHAEWVESYITVDVEAMVDGQVQAASSDSDLITKEQKEIMSSSDPNTEISIVLTYIPDSGLSDNPPRKMEFDFRINPDQYATYSLESAKIGDYMKENGIDEMTQATYDRGVLAAVTFTINSQGRVENVNLFESSKDSETDKRLLALISNMPDWTPAEYSNGLKVSQEMVLHLGDLSSCVVNLLNIRETN